jgi:hypothetical protein
VRKGGAATERAESDAKRLVARLYSCLGRYHPLVYESPYEGILHAAPGKFALSEFLRKRGAPFPPSYKRFLKMHNGWSGYVAGFTLVGVGGKHTTDARRDIRETLEIVADAWKAPRAKPGQGTPAKVVGAGGDDGAAVVDMIPFGTDFNGALLLFDPRTRRKDGEMEVLLHDTSGPSKRYRGFMEMLRGDYREISQDVRKLGKRRSGGGATPAPAVD